MSTMNKAERAYGEVLTSKVDLPIEMPSTAMPIKMTNMNDANFLREILAEDGSSLMLGYSITNFYSLESKDIYILLLILRQ